MNYLFTCKLALLNLHQGVAAAHLYAQVDHQEHRHVHDDALDQQRKLVVFVEPSGDRESEAGGHECTDDYLDCWLWNWAPSRSEQATDPGHVNEGQSPLEQLVHHHHHHLHPIKVERSQSYRLTRREFAGYWQWAGQSRRAARIPLRPESA